jgi:S-formylglutathione hydrolase FrmB
MDAGPSGYRHVMSSAWSLIGGWLPSSIQLISVGALAYAIDWRSRRWRLVLLPTCALLGVAGAVTAHLLMQSIGMAGEPAPWPLWAWIAVTTLAAGLAVLGWPRRGWWYRNATVFAASFCLLSTGLVINQWIGYFPTVATAWSQLAARPLPGELDLADALAMRSDDVQPSSGRLVKIETGSAASGFVHRPEWVYLPPAWFSRATTSSLPAVMMIGGEFNTPADWARAGDALSTVDAFAASHSGSAPVLVFADPSGGFTVDTECVNGVRGNAADHLVMDLVPYVVSTFGVSRDPARWATAGFSSGGTCALNLAVMHPGVFGGFLDVAGDERPNVGTDAQTVQRLFGGDRRAWQAFDPRSSITSHGPYSSTFGLFVVPRPRPGGDDGDALAAHRLCTLAVSRGIVCTVTTVPGHHDWPFAGAAFEAALPWLAGQLHTPSTSLAAPP